MGAVKQFDQKADTEAEREWIVKLKVGRAPAKAVPQSGEKTFEVCCGGMKRERWGNGPGDPA